MTPAVWTSYNNGHCYETIIAGTRYRLVDNVPGESFTGHWYAVDAAAYELEGRYYDLGPDLHVAKRQLLHDSHEMLMAAAGELLEQVSLLDRSGR